MPGTDARCAQCRHKGAIKAYRLNPHNWQPHYRLLCTPCRKALGYAPIDHNRSYITPGIGMNP